MVDRAVTKQLAGLEDLLLGTGSEVQSRASGDISITKIDANGLPYQATQSLRTKIGRKIEVIDNIVELQTWPTDTSADQYLYLLGNVNPGDGDYGLFWLDTTDTSSVEDLSLVYYPDNLSNGRWKRVDTSRQISANHGDQDVALAARSAGIHLFATSLTANRVVSLPVTGLYRGMTFRVVRTDTGAFTLDVGGIVTLPTGGKKWVEIVYNGTTWIQAAAGSLI